MDTTENNDAFLDVQSITDTYEKIMRESFEFWNKKYGESPLNYLLIWKKALKSNSEIVKKIQQTLKENNKQTSTTQIQLFLEMWSYAIRKSNFEVAQESMQEWSAFWKDVSDEELKVYAEILQMIEKYWKDIQNKNIE